MSYKFFIDQHRVTTPVKEWIEEHYGIEFLSLDEAVRIYDIGCNINSQDVIETISFSEPFLSGFPSWFRSQHHLFEHITKQSLHGQLRVYGSQIKALDMFLQSEPIALIMLWNDVTALTKALTFLGKKYGIPTLHVSHGVIGVLPSLVHKKVWADKIAVYGDSIKRLYISYGNPEEKIVVTGNPYWDKWRPSPENEVNAIKDSMGLDSHKKLILYAPNWYHNFFSVTDPESVLTNDLKVVLEELERLNIPGEIELMVKIHPGHEEMAPFYEQELKKVSFSHSIFTTTSPLPLIQAADLVICSGNMVIEAALIGKPVLLFYYDNLYSATNIPFDLGRYTTESGPFFLVVTREDLSNALRRVLCGCTEFPAELGEAFVRDMNGPCDGKATERVARLAIEMAGKRKPKEFISPVSYEKRDAAYYSHVRQDLPSMITGEPRKILEVGCAEGTMGESIKQRFDCEYVGLELNREWAFKAEKRLDRVIVADVEKVDLKDYGIRDKHFDYIIFGDILEHLYDPWSVLYRFKQILKDDGYILASIPNARNFKMIELLTGGHWPYQDEGVLDSTHLRFFTLHGIKNMFTNCGYAIEDIISIQGKNFDPNKIEDTANLDSPNMTIKNVSKEDVIELNTFQFLIKARPTPSLGEPGSTECSIVIPVYNRVEYTRQCLEALVENTPDELYEVIIVDNGSTDGTKEFFTSLEGDLKIINNETNLGFAKACNQGAKAASGKYLLFLNNDVEVRDDWLEPLMRVLDGDDSVAAVGSKLLCPDGTIQHAGVLVIDDQKLQDPLMARNIYHGKSADFVEANEMRTYQAVSAAALLVRKSAFEQVGGFDEGYWNGYEDIDLCFKLQEKGWKVVYQPESTMIHYESKSGPERFAKISENETLLHERWLGKIQPDVIVKEDGSIQKTGAGRIHAYSMPEISPSMASSVSSGLPQIIVSIVILTYNQLEYTEKCIESILRYTKEPYELIFVDNGSTDGTVEYLKTVQSSEFRVQSIRIIENTSNRGFAAGNNQGIGAARGDYILLLNNDIIVTDGWLQEMIRGAESDPKIGIVGPMSNYVSGPQLDREAKYSNIEEMQAYARNFAHKNKGRWLEFDRMVGFCMLIKREVLDKIGLLDERFGSGNFEDDDLCLRAERAGYKMMICGNVFVHHFGSRSFVGNNIDYTAQLEKNKEVFLEKWKVEPGERVDPYSCNEEGEKLFNEGRIEEAKERFKRALQMDNNYSRTLNNLGVILWEEGDKEGAFEHFQRANALTVGDGVSLGNLIESGYELNRYDLVEESLRNLIANDIDNPDVLYMLADCCLRQGKEEETKRMLERLLKVNPDFCQAKELLDTLN
ncbi:MAG: glycosyltransferase [Pseudomonadota bacterium]